MLDYSGVKVELVELPSIVDNYEEKENGPAYISIIKQSDLLVLFFNNPEEKQLIDRVLTKNDVSVRQTIFNKEDTIKDLIWNNLKLIKAFTKQPGKRSEGRAVALLKESTIEDLAKKLHKDFSKNFKYAKIWGKSAKFKGQSVGLKHILKDNDIVEFHLK
jgi:ribosome-interacting GTPase 1